MVSIQQEQERNVASRVPFKIGFTAMVRPQSRTGTNSDYLDFLSHLQTANWLGVASFSLICFLLISYLVLPPNKSGRHYLTIGSAIAVMFQTVR